LSVELLIVPDCPGRSPAHAQPHAVLNGLGLTDTPILTTMIDIENDAAARGFTGAPSLRRFPFASLGFLTGCSASPAGNEAQPMDGSAASRP
jgi:hypothetical protein